jgi:hypothetical protein
LRGEIAQAVGAEAEATATENRHLVVMRRWWLLLLLAGCGGFEMVPNPDDPPGEEQSDLGGKEDDPVHGHRNR